MTLDLLASQLLWPRLLLIPRLALGPGRVGLGVVGVVVVLLLGSLPALGGGAEGVVSMIARAKLDALGMALGALGRMDAAELGAAGRVLADAPGQVWTAHGVAGVLVLIPIVGVWAIVGGAISRSAACEFCQGVRLEWPVALGFGMTRWFGSVSALMWPLVLAGLIAGTIALAGWALFSAPILGILGGIVYPVMLIGSLIVVFLGAAWALGGSMLIPAIACENTDAVDSVQRAYNYTITRPARLVVYLSIGLAVGVIGVWLVLALVRGAVWLTTTAAALDGGGETLDGLVGAGSFLVSLWTGLAMAVVAGYAVSVYFTGSTVLYLLMRRVVDGQDESEIWMPGLIEGTLAEAFDPEGVRGIADPRYRDQPSEDSGAAADPADED